MTRLVKLMRTTYLTDVIDDDPEYLGAFSLGFPDPAGNGWQIVHVDWSVQGEVEVTYLMPA